MKKLSVVQQKQQKAVLAAVTAIEEDALAKLPGMLQCWFSMEYEAFPSSLLVRMQFTDASSLAGAESALLQWQKQLAAQLVKRGIVIKDMRRHLVMTCQGPED